MTQEEWNEWKHYPNLLRMLFHDKCIQEANQFLDKVIKDYSNGKVKGSATKGSHHGNASKQRGTENG